MQSHNTNWSLYQVKGSQFKQNKMKQNIKAEAWSLNALQTGTWLKTQQMQTTKKKCWIKQSSSADLHPCFECKKAQYKSNPLLLLLTQEHPWRFEHFCYRNWSMQHFYFFCMCFCGLHLLCLHRFSICSAFEDQISIFFLCFAARLVFNLHHNPLFVPEEDLRLCLWIRIVIIHAVILVNWGTLGSVIVFGPCQLS